MIYFLITNVASEYPVINGTNTQECYLNAIGECYNKLR